MKGKFAQKKKSSILSRGRGNHFYIKRGVKNELSVLQKYHQYPNIKDRKIDKTIIEYLRNYK